MKLSPITIRVVSALGRACRAVAACLVVVASLLVFPQAIPWLIAAWLAGYALLVIFGRPGRLCLIGCLAVLIGKRLSPAPGLLALMAVMLLIILLSLWHARRKEPTTSWRFAWFSSLVVWIAWGGMTVDWYAAAHRRHSVVFKPDWPVICFGDSMTSVGVFGGYPRNLQGLLSVPVVNLGISGISAKQTADEHLLKLAQLHPQVVVIELGGHDFLNGYSRASTKAYLKEIIETVRQHDAEIVLMEVPRAFISDPYWGLEREIARQEDVELISDTAMRWIFLRSTAFPPGTWLGEPYLTDESGIHPNERGKEILAEHVAQALVRLYGPAILKH